MNTKENIRNNYSRQRIASASICGGMAAVFMGAAVNSILQSGQQQWPQWTIWLLIMGGALFIIALLILVPHSWWKWFGGLSPIRIIMILINQTRNPSQYIFIQKPRFTFLPLSGGKYTQVWNYKFDIVNCLFMILKLMRLSWKSYTQ